LYQVSAKKAKKERRKMKNHPKKDGFKDYAFNETAFRSKLDSLVSKM
jgi:hypothetical protein